jgi:hypothetical protein
MKTLPTLPFGSTWRCNLYGIAADEANVIRLADGTLLDCTDAAECLDWKRRDGPQAITHWTRVLPRKMSEVIGER